MLSVLIVALPVVGLVVVVVASVRGKATNASPPHDRDRYEAAERFRNNLPPSI